jgi:hypothetical protein
MASRTADFCIDAHDPRAQVAWWAHVLDDFEPAGESTADEAEPRGPTGRWLIFLKVPEPKGNEFCVLSTRADEAGIDRR